MSVSLELEVLGEDVAHTRRHLLVDGDADDRAEPAPADELLDGLEEVVGLQLLDGELGVAGHTERVRLEHVHAGEQSGEIGGDDLLEPGEPLVLHAVLGDLRAGRLLDRHQARQRLRDLDTREPVVAVGVAQEHAEVVTHVGDVREGPSGVERQRREHREDPLLVVLAEHGLLRGVEIGVVDDVDAGGIQLGPELAEALARRLHDAPGALLGQREQLLRRVAVGRRLGDTGLDLLPQAGDAHHEELAEDRADDADELDALDERVVGVAGLVQHAVEEVEHAELAVDEEGGVAQVRVGEFGLGLELSGELLLCCPGGGLDGLPPVVLLHARAVLARHCYLLSVRGAAAPRWFWSSPVVFVRACQYMPEL